MPVNSLPRVSILIPTRDRPTFIKQLLTSIYYQTYPHHLLELVVIDDGKHSIASILPSSGIDVVYRYLDTPISIGDKRQQLKTIATGDIMVCMDDDDYYPPERVSHAVETLQKNPGIEFAFAPTFLLYRPWLKTVYRSGPWLKNWGHATFAFTRRFAESHHYNEHDTLGEERAFTRFYQVPYAVLDVDKTIIALIHTNNSVPKEDLDKTVALPQPIQYFIKNRQTQRFYIGLQGKSGGPICR